MCKMQYKNVGGIKVCIIKEINARFGRLRILRVFWNLRLLKEIFCEELWERRVIGM